jgi:hypothetical protein
MLDSGDAHVAMGRGTLASMFRLMEHAASTLGLCVGLYTLATTVVLARQHCMHMHSC